MTAIALEETDLARIIHKYNEVSERLKRSHELLGAEVCRLREELQEKNKELERRERLAALGEMAAGVAHEIRNPLGGIGLYASLLERDLADLPEQRHIARRISAGVRNLEAIIGDILAFAGGSEPHCQPTPLERILAVALDQVKPRTSALGVAMEVDGQLEGIELFCDAGQVERVLLNLLFNALDAVGEGGHIWIRAGQSRTDDGLACVIIEDDGPGLPSATGQRVFDPFFTTKDTGTGLGLAIVHRITEAHGGRVVAGPGRCGGAEFKLFLPVARGATDPDQIGGIDQNGACMRGG